MFDVLNSVLAHIDWSFFMLFHFVLCLLIVAFWYLAVYFLAVVWNTGSVCVCVCVFDVLLRQHVPCLMWSHCLWFTFDLHLDGCCCCSVILLRRRSVWRNQTCVCSVMMETHAEQLHDSAACLPLSASNRFSSPLCHCCLQLRVDGGS